MLETVSFYTFAAVMVVSSVAIVLSRNIVHSATWLLGTLGSAAGLYFLMGANLLGAVQLIVYVGGILILIVFGVMLTARIPSLRGIARPGEMLMAGVVGVVLYAAIAGVSVKSAWPAIPAPPAESLGRVAPVRDIGNLLLTDYLVPFELVSVLLLASMIGAAYLARPDKR